MRHLIRCLAVLFGIALLSPYIVQAQVGSWWEDASLLNEPTLVYVGPGFFYQDQEIFVRSGQQAIRFYTEPFGHTRTEVRVDGGAWRVLLEESGVLFTDWPNPPIQTDRVHQVELKVWRDGVPDPVRTFRLVVVPRAERAFRDNSFNTMIMWPGAGGSRTTLDKPVLVVEGIDAENENFQEAYYALGADLFGVGQSRGADVVILDFEDGGQDLKRNAEVVEGGIGYLNSIRTGSKPLVVAGVSMGGVVSRYALASMGQRGVSHGASHFVSIDAPQQGATIDSELQLFLREFPCVLGSAPTPASIVSTAAKQLLTYSAFDHSSPSLHSRFYSELNGLNGGAGYPTQTENVGVAFSTSDPNPSVGDQWLEIRLPDRLCLSDEDQPDGDQHLYIEVGTEEARAGSFLPISATQIWGRSSGLMFELARTDGVDPTFIPYESALDIVNGQTRFDGAVITPPTSTEHDFFHPVLAAPILQRIGFPVPPLSASMSGPATLPKSSTGTWEAGYSGGEGAVSYAWEWKVQYSFCGGGPSAFSTQQTKNGLLDDGGVVTPHAVECDTWHSGGTNRTYSHCEWYDATLDLKVTVTRGDQVQTAFKTVQYGDGGGGFYSYADLSEDQLEVADSAVPEATELQHVAPNPARGQAVIRFSLVEGGRASVRLYDALGREVDVLLDAHRSAGYHEVPVNAAHFSPGVYLIQLMTTSLSGVTTSTSSITITR
jgi:pimeloyl-ACP methyl ester carboxylesterase